MFPWFISIWTQWVSDSEIALMRPSLQPVPLCTTWLQQEKNLILRLCTISLTSASYNKRLLVWKVGLGDNECMSYGTSNKTFSKYIFCCWLDVIFTRVKIAYMLYFTHSKGLSVLKYWCAVIYNVYIILRVTCWKNADNFDTYKICLF